MNNAQDRSQAGWRQMEAAWRQAREDWHDSTTDYFEAHLWAPLADETKAYLSAVDELVAVLQAAQNAM